MSRSRTPRSRPASPAPGEAWRVETLLEATVRRGIQDLRDAAGDTWPDTVTLLEESSEFEESLLRALVLDWLKQRQLPPDAPPWLKVKLLARLVHALHLHRQLESAPPPGLAPWPPAERLSDSQWIWLVLDSWSLGNVWLVIFFLLGYEPVPPGIIAQRPDSRW
jgi:hypothetical protein